MIKVIERIKAATIHLLLSAIIVGFAALLVFYSWYPNALASASQVYDIFYLMVLVDVCIGPLITLIIFNKEKKELKRDLSVVGIAQVVALLFGLYAVFVARPVFIVFNASQFDVVYANQLPSEPIKNNNSLLYGKLLPINGPVVVSAQIPSDENLVKEIVYNAIVEGRGLELMPEYYTVYDSDITKDQIKRIIKSFDDIDQKNNTQRKEVDEIVSKWKSRDVNVGYVPLYANNNKLIAIIDKDNGTFLDINNLNIP